MDSDQVPPPYINDLLCSPTLSSYRPCTMCDVLTTCVNNMLIICYNREVLDSLIPFVCPDSTKTTLNWQCEPYLDEESIVTTRSICIICNACYDKVYRFFDDLTTPNLNVTATTRLRPKQRIPSKRATPQQ